MQTITATDLARNTSKILDRVLTQGECIAIERNHINIAKIVPSEKVMTAAQALEGLKPMLTPEQANAWLKNSKEEFGQAVCDPWE